VISHGPLRSRLRRVDEPNLFLRCETSANLRYGLRQRFVLAIKLPLVVMLMIDRSDLTLLQKEIRREATNRGLRGESAAPAIR
jgi:hypothetical protein